MSVKEVQRRVAVCLLAGASVVGLGFAVGSRAQSVDSSETKRKVRSLGRPVYPDLARKMNLSGVAKIEVVIGADGKVKKTRVIGGHPLLVTEAEKAAQQSEFEPGPKETVEVIEFKFTP
jgi:TonB family protein